MMQIRDLGSRVLSRRPTASRAPAQGRNARNARRRGLSLVEMIVSLAITAMLLAATMVAIDASFRAYASAAETSSRQTSTRLVVHRLLGLVRTSTAHGPLEVSSDTQWPVTHAAPGGNTLESDYIELIDANGNFVRIEYRADDNELWAITEPYGGGSVTAQPLIGGVTACKFHVHRRLDSHGVWVLERGSITMKVERDQDQTLAVESGQDAPIHVIASTMPRKLE